MIIGVLCTTWHVSVLMVTGILGGGWIQGVIPLEWDGIGRSGWVCLFQAITIMRISNTVDGGNLANHLGCIKPRNWCRISSMMYFCFNLRLATNIRFFFPCSFVSSSDGPEEKHISVVLLLPLWRCHRHDNKRHDRRSLCGNSFEHVCTQRGLVFSFYVSLLCDSWYWSISELS